MLRRCASLQTRRQQQLQHHGAAMRLQFQNVLAGVGVRRGKGNLR